MHRLRKYDTKFIDRAEELKCINNFYTSSVKSSGQTVIIFGESGIGKTRIVTEFIRKAIEEKMPTVLIGECTSSLRKPYGIWLDAVSKLATQEQLITPLQFKTTRIDEIFVTGINGILLSHVYSESITAKDEDTFIGMFTAVNDFVKDSFGDRDASGMLGRLDYGKSKILLEHGKHAWLCAVCSEETREIRNDLRFLVNKIDSRYGNILATWDGDVSEVKDIKDVISPLVGKTYVVERRLGHAEAEAERIKVYEKFLHTIINEAKKNPVIIFLDNLQWVDEGSLQLLHYVARNTKDYPVLVIGTYRPEDVTEKSSLNNILLAMKKEELYVTYELGRLKKDEVKEMILSFYPNIEYEVLSERIYKETAGNTFFVEAIFKALESENIIYRINGNWFVRPLEKISLPATIKDAVLMRVNKLSDGERKIMSISAVIGEKFRYEVLKEVYGGLETELVDILDNLIKHKFMHEIQEECIYYIFEHCKIRDVLYEDMSIAKRKVLHHTIAKAYERVYNNPAPVGKEIAEHYYLAGVYEKALEYAKLGGEYAFRHQNMQYSGECYHFALESLELLEETRENKQAKIEFMNKYGYANFILGNWDKALEFAEKSANLSSEIMNFRQTCESYKNMGEIHIGRGEYSAGEKSLRKALSIAESMNDLKTIGECSYLLGKMYWYHGDVNKAYEILQSALSISEQTKDISLNGKVLMDIGSVYHVQGKYDKALELKMKSLQIAEKLDDKHELARCYNNIGVTYTIGYKNHEKAIEYFEKQIKLCVEIGHLRNYGYGYGNAGESYMQFGNLSKALEYTNQAFEIFKKLGEKRMIGACHGEYGIIYTKMKSYDSAKEHFEKAVKIEKEINALELLAWVYEGYARMYKEMNDKENARKMFESAIEVYRKVDNEGKAVEIRKEIEKLLTDG